MPKQFRWDRSALSLHPNFSVPAQHETVTPTPQFRVQEARIWLGHWDADHHVVEGCQLRRISRTGALVQLERHLPEGKAVWVCLHGRGEQFGSVPARVAKAVLLAPKAALLWLDFGVPCPAELLYAAVFGSDALEATLN